MTRRRDGQVLVFDADDTLWENNVLFERVIDDFLEWLDHPTLDRAEIRTILDDIERANAVAHGYGSKVFLRSLGSAWSGCGSGPPPWWSGARSRTWRRPWSPTRWS